MKCFLKLLGAPFVGAFFVVAMLVSLPVVAVLALFGLSGCFNVENAIDVIMEWPFMIVSEYRDL
jgi:hypothetical protein